MRVLKASLLLNQKTISHNWSLAGWIALLQLVAPCCSGLCVLLLYYLTLRRKAPRCSFDSINRWTLRLVGLRVGNFHFLQENKASIILWGGVSHFGSGISYYSFRRTALRGGVDRLSFDPTFGWFLSYPKLQRKAIGYLRNSTVVACLIFFPPA